jgi:hypothetical protein
MSDDPGPGLLSWSGNVDVVIEISVASLLGLLQERLTRERVVFDVQARHGDTTFVFDHAVVLRLALHATPQSAYVGLGRGLVAVPGQRVRATMTMQLHLANLAVLRSLAPGTRPLGTVTAEIPVSFTLVVNATGSSVALALASPTADLSSVELDEAARAGIQRQVDATLARLVSAVTSSFDVSALAAISGGPVSVANVGLAVDGRSGDATFMQLALQVHATSTPAAEDQAVADWTRFYAAPATIANGSDWAFAVDGNLVARGTAATVQAGLAGSSQLQLRGDAIGRWLAADGSHATPRVSIDVPVRALNACGTGHHLDVVVDINGRFSVPESNILQFDSHVGHTVDLGSQLGCEFEIALIGAGAGFVIGGAIGNWVGAAVGAVAGLVTGFGAAFAAIGLVNPSLPGVPGCVRGATDQDLVCRRPFAVGGGDLFAGMAATGTASTGTSLVITGVAAVPTSAPPLTSAVVLDRWQWQRTPDGSGHVVVTEVEIRNLGGHTVLLGPVSWQGAGRELWESYVQPLSTAPLRSGQYTRLTLRVPLEALEAARTAGTLHPPEALIFTTGGARVARWTGVPDAVSEEELAAGDALGALLAQLRAAEYASLGVVVNPFPPDPKTNLFDASVLLAVVPESAGDTVPAAIDQHGTVLYGTLESLGKSIAFRAVVDGAPSDGMILASVPEGLTGDKLKTVVAKRLEDAKGATSDWDRVEKLLAGAAIGDEATVTTALLPSGRVIDVARVDIDKLTALVDELTKGRAPLNGAAPRFGTVALAESVQIQLGAETASVQVSERLPSAVDVVTAGHTTTLDLSGIEPFQFASVPAGKPDSKQTSVTIGHQLVQLQNADGMTTLRVLVQASRVETTY